MKGRTVKAKILMFVLPIVVVGLVILSGVIFTYMKSTFETQILESSMNNTKEVGDGVSEWLDKRMLETHQTASSYAAKTMNAELLNQNNVYRLNLMNQRYPGVYDSVSWGPFDNSGNLYGQTANGFKEMHNAEKAWYKQTMTGQYESFMSSPVISQATGKVIVNSIALAKNDDGKPVAMILAAIYVQSVMDKVQELKLGNDGYSLLVSKEGTYIVNPDEESIMKKKISEETDPAVVELGKKMLSGSDGIYRYTSADGDNMLAFYTTIQSTGWGMATVAYEDELMEPVQNMLKIMIAISIALLALIFGGILITVNRVMSPLGVMMKEMQTLAGGDFTDRPSQIDSEDELGMLAQSVRDMRRRVADVLKSVNDSAENLSGSAAALNSTTEQSALAANQVAQSMVKVAEGTSEQLDAVNATSEAVENLNNAIQLMASDAESAAAQSREASKIARDGGETLEVAIKQIKSIEQSSKQTTDAVIALGENSQKIGQIVDTIGGIADQTNLLALNAAIEAARAGEHGRGFAVVSEEVRKLAEESQEASQKIATLIGEIQSETTSAVDSMQKGNAAVRAGTESVERLRTTFDSIKEASSKVETEAKNMVRELKAVENYTFKIQDCNDKTLEKGLAVSKEMESVSAAAQQQSASSEEISSAADELARLAQDLQNSLQMFQY